jgi:hypothetical protein
MCENPLATHLIENFEHKSYDELSKNLSIFEYDYEGMKQERTYLHEELLAICYHPDNFTRLFETPN